MFKPKLLSVLFLVFSWTNTVLSQTNTTITGTVNDTSNDKKLHYAVVSLLNPEDSTLLTYTRTDANGRFSLPNVSLGNKLLMISYPKYADYVDVVVADGEPIDLGNINLINKSVLLNEIVIRQNTAIRVKGDTLEFNADSFQVRANASAEELLKALPGIQVDKNGKIVAHGQEVQKVLVDGEEFFSDDPTIATRNIRADAVDKVQVFDKKSDQAAFTGIDDGEKTKTINLKLKEDKKNGYFGKLSAGGGLKDKFSNEAMINYFKGKKKVSAYGIMSNTGQTQLNWDDARKYAGTEDNFEYDENSGGIYMFGTRDDFRFDGNGLPTMWTAGAHFSNKWNEDKQNFNSSYSYKKLNVYGESANRTQNILPDTVFYNNTKTQNFNQRIRNSVSGKYEQQIDSSSSIKIILNGYQGKSQAAGNHFTEAYYKGALNEDEKPINNSNRNTSVNSDESSLVSSILWRKKFKKIGRTMSVRAEQKYNSTTSDGYLGTLINYFDETGMINEKDTINQQKNNQSKFFSLNGKVTYTEPVRKDNFVELSYGFSNTNSSADRATYDYTNGKYSEVNELLTNDYDFLINTHAGGVAYRIAKKTYNIGFGSDLVHQGFKQTDNRADSSFSYSRVNLFPKLNFSYNFKPQTRLNFSYNGRTQQPTIQQIQPIRENEDPLNIYEGNPELKQSFNHNLSLFFMDYKVLKERGLFAQAGVNLIDNAITSSSMVNSGRRIYKSVNAGNMMNYWSYIGYDMKLSPSNFRVGMNLESNGGRSVSFINNVKNVTTNSSYGVSPSISYYKRDTMSFHIRGNLNYNTSISSVNSGIKTNYWIYGGQAALYRKLPFKIEFDTDANFNFRQTTSVFDKNSAIIWNASLGKRLFKETCVLKFAVNDILNQNIGFNRNIQSNFVSETTNLTLRRFWMVSFTWNFTKSSAGLTSTP